MEISKIFLSLGKKVTSVTIATVVALILLALVFVECLSSDTSSNSTSSNNNRSDNLGPSVSANSPTNIDAYVISQNFVKDYLKSPSSADFDNFGAEPATAKSGNTFTISYHFEALNSFNAKLRSNYTCVLTYVSGDLLSKNSWQLESLVIDGEKVAGSSAGANNIQEASAPIASGAPNNEKVQPIKYTILGIDNGCPDGGCIDVLISPACTNGNIKWVCKDLAKKRGSKRMTICFYKSKADYDVNSLDPLEIARYYSANNDYILKYPNGELEEKPLSEL